MITGFWKTHKKTKGKVKNTGKEALSFSFMKNYGFPVTMYAPDYKKAKTFTAYDFIQGDCNVFAQFLNEKYGYDIVAEFERDEETGEPWLIHMYCTYEGIDGGTVYVDARGKCTDYDRFMEEFLGDGYFCDESRKYKEIHKMIPDEYRVRNDNWKYYNAKKLDSDLCCYAPDA